MCNRHDNYQFLRYGYQSTSFDRVHHEIHLYLVPFKDWAKVKEKVKKKMNELLKKRVDRSRELVHKTLKCENFTDDELFWDLTWKIEGEDQLFRQYATGQELLEDYLSCNEYFEGMKTTLRHFSYKLTQRVNCKNCRHSMQNHGGEYSEGECHGSGDTIIPCKQRGKLIECKKFVWKPEDKLMIQRLSGTVAYETGLDGKIIMDERVTRLLGENPPIFDGIIVTGEQAHLRRYGTKTDYSNDPNAHLDYDDDEDDEEEAEKPMTEIEKGLEKTLDMFA